MKISRGEAKSKPLVVTSKVSMRNAFLLINLSMSPPIKLLGDVQLVVTPSSPCKFPFEAGAGGHIEASYAYISSREPTALSRKSQAIAYLSNIEVSGLVRATSVP